MENMTIKNAGYDFSAVHGALQSYVDREILAGVSSAVLVGRELVDVHTAGWADKENHVPLRTDHLFRVFSNSKLVTSCAVLLLMEEGRLKLDDAIEAYIPQLGRRRVLKPGARSIDDSEPAASPITIRHLLSHSSGLGYGFLNPGSVMDNAYNERKVMNAVQTLAEMIDVLADLPLGFHPGTRWEYSVATDVLGRLVEVISGQRFDHFLQQRIFTPLGMVDTGFVVSADKLDRFTAYYAGTDPFDALKPGLKRLENAPFPGAFVTPVPRLSGGGGLVSSLPDMVALIRSLLPGGPTLLKHDTIAQMMSNQLPAGLSIGFPGIGPVPGKAYGLAGAVTLQPSSLDPAASAGEFEWGGIAGTHWWISPRHNLAGLLMTQRQMAFWHPFSFEFKRGVYQAVL
ncbi:serine hydrolase domain-containing protein [Undibacterium sp.]|jgi:CubicO group peptidase (beta-lactamase class C family)|uniref:serine hydrolase domain-containing protein n=1 Tax=Undibacterium sp. TaxID=1914977 RepID=UPI002CC12856|nr:serine hydrolase domain-containing protein [Undibacterium sp.]HTD04544.1 serine hydrolase domain-containing protein [Undibacterium sp.]